MNTENVIVVKEGNTILNHEKMECFELSHFSDFFEVHCYVISCNITAICPNFVAYSPIR